MYLFCISCKQLVATIKVSTLVYIRVYISTVSFRNVADILKICPQVAISPSRSAGLESQPVRRI